MDVFMEENDNFYKHAYENLKQHHNRENEVKAEKIRKNQDVKINIFIYINFINFFVLIRK